MGFGDAEAPLLFALADFECSCGGNRRASSLDSPRSLRSGKRMEKDKPTAWAHWEYKLLLKYFRVAPWNKRGAGKGCLSGVIIHVPVYLLNGAGP